MDSTKHDGQDVLNAFSCVRFIEKRDDIRCTRRYTIR